MGGGNSTNITSTSIQNSTITAVTQILQSSSNSASTTESLNIDCNQFNKDITTAYLSCLDKVKNPDGSIDPAKVIAICGPIQTMKCGADHVDFSSTLHVNLTSDQISQIQQDLSSNLSDTIKSQIQQDNGPLEFDNNANNSVTSVANAVTTIMTLQTLQSLSTLDNVESITVSGGTVSFVSMNTVVDFLSKISQSSTAFITSTTKLAADLEAVNDQSSGLFNLKDIRSLVIGIIIILVAIGVVLWVLKNVQLKNNNNGAGMNKV